MREMRSGQLPAGGSPSVTRLRPVATTVPAGSTTTAPIATLPARCDCQPSWKHCRHGSGNLAQAEVKPEAASIRSDCPTSAHPPRAHRSVTSRTLSARVPPTRLVLSRTSRARARRGRVIQHSVCPPLRPGRSATPRDANSRAAIGRQHRASARPTGLPRRTGRRARRPRCTNSPGPAARRRSIGVGKRKGFSWDLSAHRWTAAAAFLA